jgi:hypothetical protein
MYASRAGNLLSLSSMLLMVRDARSMGLSVGGAGSACCCCGGGCDMEPVRVKPGLLGAGVLTKAPGVGRWGVAGAIWKAMMGWLCVESGRDALVVARVRASFRWRLGKRAGSMACTWAARESSGAKQAGKARREKDQKKCSGAIATLRLRYKLQK